MKIFNFFGKLQLTTVITKKQNQRSKTSKKPMIGYHKFSSFHLTVYLITQKGYDKSFRNWLFLQILSFMIFHFEMFFNLFVIVFLKGF